MFEYARDIVQKAEATASGPTDLKRALSILRTLPLDDFGKVMISMPSSEMPRLSALLPAMASPEIQRNWTGNAGESLLHQTNTFVRIVRQNYLLFCSTPMQAARILDFGCGYGRIMRSMYHYVDPDRVFGCDPWDQSVALCKEAGIPSPVEQSDYLPTSLPFSGKFDLIYAFSVFTHLSERATKAALDTLERYLSDDGVIVITIRPVEYWAVDKHASAAEATALANQHRTKGFAFKPHDRGAVDGDITYGDTSMTFDYLARTFPTLRLVKIECTMEDPYQVIAFLKRRPPSV